MGVGAGSSVYPPGCSPLVETLPDGRVYRGGIPILKRLPRSPAESLRGSGFEHSRDYYAPNRGLALTATSGRMLPAL